MPAGPRLHSLAVLALADLGLDPRAAFPCREGDGVAAGREGASSRGTRARAQPNGDKVEAVPCSTKSPKQQWASINQFGTAKTTHVLKNKASGKCLQARVATRSSRYGIRRGRGNSGARRARLGPAPQASSARRVRQVKKHAEEKVGWTVRGVRFCVEVGAATLMDTMAVMEEEQKKKAKVPVNLFCKFCS